MRFGTGRKGKRYPAMKAFVGRQGPSSASCSSNLESPVNHFLLIFTADVLGKVATEANSYASQNLQAFSITDSGVSTQNHGKVSMCALFDKFNIRYWHNF